MDVGETLVRSKRPLLYVQGSVYIIAGVMHFVIPEAYAQLIPPIFPVPLLLVYLTGIAEIALGVGLLVPRTRRIAAWGLIVLLLAVFPANVYMAISGVVVEGFGSSLDPSPAVRWGRLPFQGVLICWAWWYTRPIGGE